MTFSCVSTRCRDLKADATPFSTTTVRARNLWCAILEIMQCYQCYYAWHELVSTFADLYTMQAQNCRGKMQDGGEF